MFNIFDYSYKIRHKIKEIGWEVRYAIQRAIRGYSSPEIFSMDYYFLKRTYSMLKDFRKNTMGYPVNMTEDEWTKVLDRMIDLLRWILYFKEDYCVIPENCKEYKELNSRHNNMEFNSFLSEFRKIYDKYDKIKDDNGVEHSLTDRIEREVQKMQEEFFELFVKHFNDLWY